MNPHRELIQDWNSNPPPTDEFLKRQAEFRSATKFSEAGTRLTKQ